MTAKDFQTGLHKAVRRAANLPDSVPKEKVTDIIKRLALGIAVCILGKEGLDAGWHQGLVVGIFFVGGNIISNQLLAGIVKKSASPVISLFKAFKDASKGE